MKVIDEQLLNEISRQAKESPRLRMNYNFHPSLEDKCHRMLNAVELTYPYTGIRQKMSRLLC